MSNVVGFHISLIFSAKLLLCNQTTKRNIQKRRR